MSTGARVGAEAVPAPSPAAGPRDVVYVIASMIVGGTQTHLLQVFRSLDRDRFRPHLYCLRDGGQLIDAVRGLDVPVRTFAMHGSLKDPRDFVGLLRMRAALARERPALVHGYLLRGNFYAAAAGRLARVPAVITSKRGTHLPAGAAERFAVRTSNRLSDVITGNSPIVLDFTREREPPTSTPMVMIPSGIDTDVFDPADLGDLRTELGLGAGPVVGTAITFRPRKGFRMLFEAFAAVRQQVPEARLLIAGEERLHGDPEELANALGIADAVVMLGRRTDMPRVLASFDVFVLPSESEGMSNAILEAMAMRRPVVATAVGGAPVVIEEGRSGFLVDYPDSASLAARICTLLADPALRARVGEAARQRVVAAYSARGMVGQIEDLYERVLAARARAVDGSRRTPPAGVPTSLD